MKEEDSDRYYFHSDYKTFEQAQEFCQQEDGEMIEPNSEDSNHAISSAASSKGINKFWIGIHYNPSFDPECESSTCTDKCDGKEDQLKFVYASTNQNDLKCRDVYDPEFTFWSVDPPECGEKCENYCVKGGHKWNAIPCETEMAFICEKLEENVVVVSGKRKRALFTKPTNKVTKTTINNTTLGHFKKRNTQGKY